MSSASNNKIDLSQNIPLYNDPKTHVNATEYIKQVDCLTEGR